MNQFNPKIYSSLTEEIPKRDHVHPTAIIEDGADIAEGVVIGPYCHVGSQVKLKTGVKLISHVSLAGSITLGERTVVYPFASLGHPPQDLKYQGEPSHTIIGHDTVIREYVTVQPGTNGDKLLTQVGSHCLLMVGSHVAHDCKVGDHVILANNATLAGHVEIGDYAIVGGLSAIHQRVRVGEHAIIGGMSGVEKDVIPYAMVLGERAYLKGLNLIGLKRRGFSTEAIQQLMEIYQRLFEEDKNTPLADRVHKVEMSFKDNSNVAALLDFIRFDSKRPLCLPKHGR
jgi:UDP-N-acetylglucosamine acyltransferase